MLTYLETQMANAAAGGVGFGAGEWLYATSILCGCVRSTLTFRVSLTGAAIGSGLVNAIF